MEVKKTKINGVFLIKPQVFKTKEVILLKALTQKSFTKLQV